MAYKSPHISFVIHLCEVSAYMEISCNGVISCNVHTPFATSNSLDIWLVYTSVFILIYILVLLIS